MNLHFHDECEAILFMVKSNPKHHSKPVLLTPKVETFYGTILAQKPKSFMTQFEAFAINGVTGKLHSTI